MICYRYQPFNSLMRIQNIYGNGHSPAKTLHIILLSKSTYDLFVSVDIIMGQSE